MSKPPKIVIPGMNRGAGVPGGYMVGRRRGAKQGPLELLNLTQVRAAGIATTFLVTSSTSLVQSVAHSEALSLSTAVSSSLSGAVSSTTSLSSAVSTVISGSISVVNSRIDSLSTAGGGGATTFLALTDTPAAYTGAANKAVTVNAAETALEFTTPSGGTGQSTSLSQISSSLSGAISSTTSLSTGVSTVDSGQSVSLSQISSSLSGAISSTNSLSSAVSTVISGSISTVESEIAAIVASDNIWAPVVDGSNPPVFILGSVNELIMTRIG